MENLLSMPVKPLEVMIGKIMPFVFIGLFQVGMVLLILLPSIIMTGFMFPFQGMPDWAQAVGSCIPLTYFVRIVRGIMLKGAEFADILPNLWPLGVIVIFLTAVTMKAYKNTLD